MEWFQLLAPYLDSVSSMLILGIIALWGMFTRKDIALLGCLESEINMLKERLTATEAEIKNCEHERLEQEVKRAKLELEIEGLKRRCAELEQENKTLRNMYNKFELEKIGL